VPGGRASWFLMSSYTVPGTIRRAYRKSRLESAGQAELSQLQEGLVSKGTAVKQLAPLISKGDELASSTESKTERNDKPDNSTWSQLGL
jgi:hypothetical protein